MKAVVACIVLIGLAEIPTARAQGPDPFHCLPPATTRLWIIASNNLARRYRDNPTAENKAAMCKRFADTVVTFDKAFIACSKNTCRDRDYIANCRKQKTTADQWRKRVKKECS